jgi:cytochrome P450
MNAPLDTRIGDDVASMALDSFDVSDPQLYQDDVWYPYFARLRRDDPVHYCRESPYGPYWSVTKYKDIMQVEVNHQVYSSDGAISILDPPKGLERQSFIAMDPPKHDEQRLVVAPAVGPGNLAKMEALIRERTGRVLDGLPRNETFDWVDRVSIELTSMMLATLFDYPLEDRRQLIYWSDVVIANVDARDSPVHSEEEKFAELTRMTEALGKLFAERAQLPAKFDLLSMMAHGGATRDLAFRELMGNLSLLLVGGNDTTRNSMTGGLMALAEHPGEYEKLRGDPGLIPSMVSEIIRYVTPVIHMRRTVLADTELGGKAIKAGDKVVMWYVSGNRDPEEIEDPDNFIIDRPRARHHLSFGFGIHRCVGNRLAELQLRILWEEILKRYPVIEVVGPARRVYSNFIHGIRSLPVRIPG